MLHQLSINQRLAQPFPAATVCAPLLPARRTTSPPSKVWTSSNASVHRPAAAESGQIEAMAAVDPAPWKEELGRTRAEVGSLREELGALRREYSAAMNQAAASRPMEAQATPRRALLGKIGWIGGGLVIRFHSASLQASFGGVCLWIRATHVRLTNTCVWCEKTKT